MHGVTMKITVLRVMFTQHINFSAYLCPIVVSLSDYLGP